MNTERTVLLKDFNILTRYRFKKILFNYQNNCRTFKLDARISKFFAALLIIFEIPIKLFVDLCPAKF